MLAHERLQVYGKAWDFAAEAAAWCAAWDKRPALVDQEPEQASGKDILRRMGVLLGGFGQSGGAR